jgi:hypothetical protein
LIWLGFKRYGFPSAAAVKRQDDNPKITIPNQDSHVLDTFLLPSLQDTHRVLTDQQWLTTLPWFQQRIRSANSPMYMPNTNNNAYVLKNSEPRC